MIPPSLPIRPQPKPAVILKRPISLLATRYSDAKTPVPARSLRPREIAGEKFDSFLKPTFKSKPLSFQDWFPL